MNVQKDIYTPGKPTLVVKESYFRKWPDEGMHSKRHREQPALPVEKTGINLPILGSIISKLPLHEVKLGLWRQCIYSIGQACKELRKKPIQL